MRIAQFAIVGIIVSFLATAATAAVTLTFDGVQNEGGGCPNPELVENRFVIENCPEWFVSPGTIHLVDSGAPYPDFVGFTGPIFSAVSIVIRPLQHWFLDNDTLDPVPYNNVLFRGFRGGSLVAEQAHTAFPFVFGDEQTVAFSAAFTDLDYLEVRNVLPSAAERAANGNAICFDNPCAHVDLMEITLSPVPLPAALSSMLLGLAGFVGMGAMRRRLRARASA